jgi:hypothetical protein
MTELHPVEIITYIAASFVMVCVGVGILKATFGDGE